MSSEQDIYILGLSFDYHDAAAALIKNGKVVAAVQEERFTRDKQDSSLPAHSIKYCLDFAGITSDQLSYVVFYEKPFIKFERLLKTYISTWPLGFLSFLKAMLVFLKTKLWVESRIRKALDGYKGSILFTQHHYSHAASAYFCSGFSEAIVVTMDGVGEFDTTTFGYGKGNKLNLSHTLEFPHSLGLFYSALTYYLGFKVNSAEYKVMGLAPYGDPNKYYDTFKELVEIRDDGSVKLNMKYFSYEYGLRMTNRRFDKLFGGPARQPESPLTQREKDIAAALQKITNEIVLKIIAQARTLYPYKNLCLAGGVALNCVTNGKILEKKWFDNIYIQPAAGDAGGAVGAALYVYFDRLNKNYPLPEGSTMETVYLGPEYSESELEKFLEEDVKAIIGEDKKLVYKRLEYNDLIDQVSNLINGNNVIGWFQGRMEYGPRSLGNRSIIADARNKENWQKVNLKIKFRESFRPFAPTVLEDKSAECFDLTVPSPYMLLVAPVKRTDVPAITHVDNSARVQTVNPEQNKKYYDLIEAFYKKTGCPIIINTSFNVRGEPIVMSPQDAFNTFLHTFMDYLVMGNYIISKQDNQQLVDKEKMNKYLGKFKLD
ncbi:MAG: carbamoyltransferase [Candidatus Magasanikbacteria bacterium]|nr:carbamoyltransferase [Candidatus Magasanikbacteria bacterium]